MLFDTPALIERLNIEHSTFTTADMTRAVAEAAQVAGGGLTRTRDLVTTLASDPEIVPLADDRYTTRAMLGIEQGALERAKRMAADRGYAMTADARSA